MNSTPEFSTSTTPQPHHFVVAVLSRCGSAGLSTPCCKVPPFVRPWRSPSRSSFMYMDSEAGDEQWRRTDVITFVWLLARLLAGSLCPLPTGQVTVVSEPGDRPDEHGRFCAARVSFPLRVTRREQENPFVRPFVVKSTARIHSFRQIRTSVARPILSH